MKSWRVELTVLVMVVVSLCTWRFIQASLRPDYIKAMTHQGYEVTVEKTKRGGIMYEGVEAFYQLKSNDSPQQALLKLDKAIKRAGFVGAPPPRVISFTPYKQDDVAYRKNALEDVGLSLPTPATSSYICAYQSSANVGVSKSYTQVEIFPSNGQTTIELSDVSIVLS